jgi:Electron transfer DM13
MPSIGDLANDLARTLYDLRIPVAILSVVGLVALALVAYRLGWIAAARRHPARTAVLTIALLIVVLPIGWYLASPLVIRTSLVEALPSTAPVEIAESTTASLAPSSPSAAPVASSAPTPSPLVTPPPVTPTPFEPATVTTGEFDGTDDFHFGEGTASIIEIAPGRYHLRLEDFSVRNGPDLYVYLSPDPDGYDDAALELGTLKATDGSFGYDLPDGVDPTGYRSALIWCKQFSHLFAVATLTGA